MFLGEAMCLPAYYAIRCSRHGVIPPDDPYVRVDPTSGLGARRFLGLAFLLAGCDLL